MNPMKEALHLGLQAAKDGFDWRDPLLAMEKVQEEVFELIQALKSQSPDAIVDELGDVLFSVVQVARLAEVDAPSALEHANQKFASRYAAMQQLVENQNLAALSLAEQTILWKRVKEDTA